MANKQQRAFRKLGLATCNGGANTTVSKVNHGSTAFQDAAVAMKRKKKEGKRCSHLES